MKAGVGQAGLCWSSYRRAARLQPGVCASASGAWARSLTSAEPRGLTPAISGRWACSLLLGRGGPVAL